MADMAASVSTAKPTNPEHLLPPGFRFHPTDEELILHYLRNRASAVPIPVSIIAEVDIYKFDPWELPAKAVFGDREWYFFSPRDRKYPNGVRPNRAAGSGYWKATGTDKPILLTGTSAGRKESVGVKKALVFYTGKPPKGSKTNWIMHEYRLPESAGRNNAPAAARRILEEQRQKFFYGNANDNPAQLQSKDASPSSSPSMRLDDWVLCRIYEKANHNNTTHPTSHQQHSAGSTLDPDRCADGDLDMEESSDNHVTSSFAHHATNTSPPTATLNQPQHHHEQEQERYSFYRSLPKAASLSDLLAETDLSMVSRLLYDTPMPPPTVDVAAGQPPQHLTADPPSTACSHQRIDVHSVNAVASPNLTLTSTKRQLVRPETGSVLHQFQASKKQRHAAAGFTGQGARPSAYDNIINGCSTFPSSSTCNLTAAAGAGFASTSTGAQGLFLDVAPRPSQLTVMTTTSSLNHANATHQPFMMSRLHQAHLQMQFLNTDYNGSVKLH